MPNYANSDRHNRHSKVAQELTLRLGTQYQELCEWACTEGVADTLELAYHTIGLDHRTVAIANLVDEFSHPESDDIISEWQDDFYIASLSHFVRLFRSSPRLSTLYAPVGQGDNADKIRSKFGELKNRTFLLALITTTLPVPRDSTLYLDRRRLRLWLVMQAMRRLAEHKCYADRYISRAARFMILDEHDAKWELVDEVLRTVTHFLAGSTPTFQRFSGAVRLAADQLSSDVDTNAQFLNALMAIARGEWSEIRPEPPKSERPPIFLVRPPILEPVPVSNEDEGPVQILAKSGEDDDDPEDLLLVSVDTSDTDGQQKLKSNSFFIQQVEDAHYLPWSWTTVLPTEQQALGAWIDEKLEDTDPKVALGASLTWLARKLGRSLFFVQQIQISDSTDSEWSINSDLTELSRLSPRRRNSWTPDDISSTQIEGFALTIRLQLPAAVGTALRRAMRATPEGNKTLAAAWDAISHQSLDVWFGEYARQHFPRIKSTMLGTVAGQNAYAASGDPNFSRLISAHPNSGLPGACGYGNWDIAAVENGLSMAARSEPAAEERCNVLGSILSPLESVLHKEISNAASLVRESADTGNWLMHHNRYTQYCVMALYAGTGCRHLRDPFDSFNHFSSKYRCVYVNDKSDGERHQGRLVPVPDKLLDLLEAYRGYLTILSNALEPHRPKLAGAIKELINNGESTNIPLFFLLDERLFWQFPSDIDLPGIPVFHWALPSNLFRHRYSQQLSRSGVCQEIIDGWMGHSERGASSYSDYSPRCWIEDAESYRETINKVFESLPFSVPKTASLQIKFENVPEPTSTDSSPEVFGAQRRKLARQKARRQEIRNARFDIALYLESRTFDELETKELDALVSLMLFRESRIPHRYAALRLRTLLKAVERSGCSSKKSIRRRVLEVKPERSLVSSTLPKALEHWSKITTWGNVTRQTVIKARLSKSQALAIGAALLAIEKRISYLGLLMDVAQGRHYRIIQHKKTYLLEYSENLSPEDFTAPVQRHTISYKVASLLAYGQGLKSQNSPSDMPIKGELSVLSDTLSLLYPKGTTVMHLLSSLSRVIDQSNIVVLPGMVAGSLSDRQPPTSPPLLDHLRLLEGKNYQFPSELAPQIETISNFDFIQLNQGSLEENDKEQLQLAAKSVLDEISQVLTIYEKSQSRKAANEIEKICSKYSGKCSTSILLLGQWVAHLARSGYGRRKKSNPYTRDSLLRYLTALRFAFSELAYSVDLIEADDEKVTSLYFDMVEYSRDRGIEVPYFGKRLQAFQRWASACGVEEPDWSEIDIGGDCRHVRPGLISENDYLACQSLIRQEWGENTEEGLFLGFVMLLAYRFGLRSKEAIGLHREDWCEEHGAYWVLVRNNPVRELKSKASRRAVPLLSLLQPEEVDLIAKVLARYTALAGMRKNLPILCRVRAGKLALSNLTGRLPKKIIAVIRQVTGNNQLVLHHLRHSYYNRAATALLGINTPLARQTSGEDNPLDIRKTVLGEHSAPSRRSGMALARLLGHSLPGVGLKNYFHLMTDWADALTPVDHTRARVLPGVLNTASLLTVPKPKPKKILCNSEYSPADLHRTFRVLRLAAMSKNFERAGEMMNFAPEITNALNVVFEISNRRMRFKYSNNGEQFWINGDKAPWAFLQKISEVAWTRLLEWSEGIDLSIFKPEDVSIRLQEVPLMVGRNRHVLMRNGRHRLLVSRVIKALNLTEDQFSIVARGEEAESTLTNDGFLVRPKYSPEGESINSQLDPLVVRVSGVQQPHGGLILKRCKSGVVRNGYELAIVVLVVGILIATTLQHSGSVSSQFTHDFELIDQAIFELLDNFNFQ